MCPHDLGNYEVVTIDGLLILLIVDGDKIEGESVVGRVPEVRDHDM